MVASWESQVLGDWEQRLDLTSDNGCQNILYERSGEQTEALYEMLRKIAILKLEKPDLTLNVWEHLTFAKISGSKLTIEISRSKL